MNQHEQTSGGGADGYAGGDALIGSHGPAASAAAAGPNIGQAFPPVAGSAATQNTSDDWWNRPAGSGAVRAAAPQTAPLSMPPARDSLGTAPLDDTAPLDEHMVAPPQHQGFAAAALRDVGMLRAINQDSVFVFTTTLPREGNDLQIGLFVVADGMGGHDGGEIASRMAVSTVAQHVLAELVVPALFDDATEALQPLIIAAVQRANRAIWDHAQSIGSDMGTTCTVALLLGHTAYIGHVGDSRLYMRQDGELQVLTADHSAVGRLIAVGQLEHSAARDHPLRSQLYRTVGQTRDVQVDFVRQPVRGATHLLLCSDGLWGMLDDGALNAALANNLWPHDACRTLIDRANEAGGEDNISAIVVSLPV